jgi:hypothetical protein
MPNANRQCVRRVLLTVRSLLHRRPRISAYLSVTLRYSNIFRRLKLPEENPRGHEKSL